MTDTLSPSERSERMGRVHSGNTKPEMRVRRLVHAMGYRYRLHCRDMPGTPDLVFRGRRKVIFVHGCFFHRHPGCALARLPKSKHDFWLPKLEGNKVRDDRNIALLRSDGWAVLVVWECETKGKEALEARIRRFLDNGEETT